MKDTDTPLKIPRPWAVNAGAPYINSPVPTDSQIGIINGAASFDDGFPPLAFVSLSSGGAGPFGRDFNGLLNQATAGLQWLQAGAPLFFDSVFVTNVGGYPKGSVIRSANDFTLAWLSLVDDNVANPDVDPTNWGPIAIQTPSFRNFLSFDETQTWVATTNFALCGIIGGGGGGGAGAALPASGGGGGGGGGMWLGYLPFTIGTGYNIVIGTGGSGGPSPGTNGSYGGTSGMGSLAAASGGSWGNANGASGAGGIGNSTFPGLALTGTSGLQGFNYLSASSVQGAMAGSGGNAPWTGGGAPNAFGGASYNGNAPGGGGSGGATGTAAGAGADGIIFMYW